MTAFWKKLLSRKNNNKSGSQLSEFADKIESITGLKPKGIEIYQEAFTHRSAQRKDENGNNINFERLEFLGDAILGAVIANYLFRQAPGKQEGYLTKMRSKIVSRNHLNALSKSFGLAGLLQHNHPNAQLGEDVNGDLFEALIGAIYLDHGYRLVEEFITKKIINSHIDIHKLETFIASHKSLILEWSQKSKNNIRFNTFEEDNAEDLTIFVSIVRLNDKVISKGRGTSKKKAEENASKRAYYSLQKKIDQT